MNRKLIVLNVLSLVLAGCSKPYTVAPKNMDYPQKTRAGVSYVAHQVDLSQNAWWKKINDSTLDRLVAQALASNNQILGAKETIKEAQAQLKEAQYAWIPTLDASGHGFTGGTWNTNITPNGVLAKTSIFSNTSNLRFHGYFSGFTPGYTFNVLNNVYNIKAARASLAVVEAQTQMTKLSIIAQVTGAYFMLLSQRQQLAIEQALSHDLKNLQQLERVRFTKGASDIETLTDLEQQLAQEEARIPQIVMVISKNENAIQLLTNHNPGVVKTHASLFALNINPLLLKSIPSSVLKKRPDIMIALNNLKMADAAVGVAYAAFFPTIRLTSLVGDSSVDLVHILNLGTNFWIAQAKANIALINASSYEKIKATKASLNATYYDYIQTLRSAFVDVDDNITTVQKNRATYLFTEKACSAAKKAYDIAMTQYTAGAKDYRSVMNAKLNLDRAQLSLVQQKAQLLDSIVQAYTALAGGADLG